jgi:exonuclease VII small subunit
LETGLLSLETSLLGLETALLSLQAGLLGLETALLSLQAGLLGFAMGQKFLPCLCRIKVQLAVFHVQF